MLDSAVALLGHACHEWNYQAGSCREMIPVHQLSGTQTAHFVSKLAAGAAAGSPAPLDLERIGNRADDVSKRDLE